MLWAGCLHRPPSITTPQEDLPCSLALPLPRGICTPRGKKIIIFKLTDGFYRHCSSELCLNSLACPHYPNLHLEPSLDLKDSERDTLQPWLSSNQGTDVPEKPQLSPFSAWISVHNYIIPCCGRLILTVQETPAHLGHPCEVEQLCGEDRITLVQLQTRETQESITMLFVLQFCISFKKITAVPFSIQCYAGKVAN